MSHCWKLSLACSRADADRLMNDDRLAVLTEELPTLVTREIDPAQPEDWMIDIYLDERPDGKRQHQIARLFPFATQAPVLEKLAPQDWVTLSQQGLKPFRAGRFHIHTSDHAPLTEPTMRNICIDAGQAFGTGHHETTTGCLESLDRLKRTGFHYRNIIDVGSGTGLLAFAAHYLWPQARIIASDIDPVAAKVCRDNAASNGIRRGIGPGSVQILQSNGLDHFQIRRQIPYDLIIANILAGPLIALAPQLAAASAVKGKLILAGLLETQRRDVIRAYQRHGFRVERTASHGDWPCLLLVRHARTAWQGPGLQQSPLASDYFGEC